MPLDVLTRDADEMVFTMRGRSMLAPITMHEDSDIKCNLNNEFQDESEFEYDPPCIRSTPNISSLPFTSGNHSGDELVCSLTTSTNPPFGYTKCMKCLTNYRYKDIVETGEGMKCLACYLKDAGIMR